MAPIDVTFDLPSNIAAGLADNTLLRNGGVIQDNAGRVVTWLREVTEAEQVGAVSQAGGATSAMSLIDAGSMLTLGVSVLGFTVIYAKLKEIEGQLKEFQKAIEDIDESLKINPHPLAYESKAYTYILLDEIDLAIENIRSAIEIDPSRKKAILNDPDFDKIRNDSRFINLLNIEH